jgi:hypothetical protein
MIGGISGIIPGKKDKLWVQLTQIVRPTLGERQKYAVERQLRCACDGIIGKFKLARDVH